MATRVGSPLASGKRQSSNISRNDFPQDFIFGSSCSAFQTEGARNVRGDNIWDIFTYEHPDMIADGSNADVAIKFYEKYEEDLCLAKDLNLDSFVLSISWARILPGGRITSKQGVSQEGIQFYTNLLQSLHRKGIEPAVTLYHFDVPQALEDDYMGLLNRRFVDDFRDYAEVCFKNFGHLVKKWITINEPYFVAAGGYGTGQMPPGRCTPSLPIGVVGAIEFWNFFAPIRKRPIARSHLTDGDSGTEPYTVAHTMLLAHAAAVKKYREMNQGGMISMGLVVTWLEPYSEAARDKLAAKRGLDFMLGWFLEPLTTGDYPAIMRKLVGDRLPMFTTTESESLKGSIDFLALHYYTALYAKDGNLQLAKPNIKTDPHVTTLPYDIHGIPIGPQAASGWLYVYPKGIYDLLKHIKTNYNNPLIYITENGYGEKIISKEKDLNDQDRIKYHKDHLSYIRRAMRAGANVKGYYSWCFSDNFELTDGFTIRFGMVYVDYENEKLERTPKQSYCWYKDFLKKLPQK